ncbi:hypothetical protein MK805_00610 [Shimazuella sp. AN120528]|uniref:hypothetical protein n=1 Tax=Shimazuella soli TaxID=1892854 RepID=UPI001F0EF1ED|nr:hypothetical protein [Shimazuella soli]MCH5583474.1 hypothetical protein [Shimazuella soli]
MIKGWNKDADNDYGLVILQEEATKEFFELATFPIRKTLQLQMVGFSADKLGQGLFSQTILVEESSTGKAISFAYSHPGMSGTPVFSKTGFIVWCVEQKGMSSVTP